MPQVSIRELQRNAGGVLKEVARSGRPALVTSHGKPVVAVVPLKEEDLEDWVLATAAEFVSSRRQADAELAAGETTSLDEFLAEESGSKSRTASAPRKGAKATSAQKRRVGSG